MAVQYEGISGVELLKIRLNTERTFAGRGLSPAVAPVSIHTAVRNSEDRTAKIFAAAFGGVTEISSDTSRANPMIKEFQDNRAIFVGKTLTAPAYQAKA